MTRSSRTLFIFNFFFLSIAPLNLSAAIREKPAAETLDSSTGAVHRRLTIGQVYQDEQRGPVGLQRAEQWLGELTVLVYALFGIHGNININANPGDAHIDVSKGK